jgi:hypothetical protein
MTATQITCPTCGTVSNLESVGRDSGSFCSVCDYPLFWAQSLATGDGAGGLDGEAGLRRLPGTAGRHAVATLYCPACTEPNPVTGVACIRCGADLHPRPEPVVFAPPPPPPPPAPPPPAPPPPRVWWPWVLLGLAIVAVFLVVILTVTLS